MNIRRHHVAIAALVLVVAVVVLLNLPNGERPAIPTGAWAAIGAGARITCAMDRQGRVACWGASQAPPAGLHLRRLSVGGHHACGITATTGAVTCWGRDFKGSTRPPSGEFVELSAGWDFTCGIRKGGRVACWGWNSDGQATAPGGTFTSLAAGYHHTCGVRADGAVACWGVNRAGQGDAPPGPFTQVVVSQCHTCGLRPSGKVACWGCDLSGATQPGNKADSAGGRNTPPDVRFRRLSAGFLHTCGVTTADTIRCWGHNAVGQSAPPPGKFSRVEAGFFHTCGVAASGTLECWGWREPVLAVPGQKAVMARAQAQPVAPGAPVPGLTDHTCPYEGMGLLYLRQGRADEALKSLTRATEIVGNTDYRKFMTMARRHIEQGRRAEAERMMSKAHAALRPPGAQPGGTVEPTAPAPRGLPPRCKRHDDCPVGQRCHEPHGRCYTRCGEADSSCPPGRPCDRTAGLCRSVRPPCARSTDCPSGQICNVDGCMPRCSAASPTCPAGFLCDVYLRHCRVQPAHCVRGTQCTRVSVCHREHRRCYARCSKRSPCSVGMRCDVHGACVPRGAPCTMQRQCEGAGERCFAQGCLTTCSSKNVTCPAGRRCNQVQGICE